MTLRNISVHGVSLWYSAQYYYSAKCGFIQGYLTLLTKHMEVINLVVEMGQYCL